MRAPRPRAHGPRVPALLACGPTTLQKRSREAGLMRATILAAFAAASWFVGSATAQVTVLTNATVIDGTGSPPQSVVAIVIADGRIIDLVQPPSGTLTRLLTGPGTTVVDLTGKFVVPG